MAFYDENDKCRNISGCFSSVVIRLIVCLLLHLTLSHDKASAVSSACRVEYCSREFSRRIRVDNIYVGRSADYCTLLTWYDACLWATSRACRGNLKFHSLRTLVSKQNAEFDCVVLIKEHRKQQQNSNKKCVLYNSFQKKSKSGYRYCAVFGNGHVRTFDSQYETCSISGHTHLIDNEKFSIKITGSVSGTPFSRITKITVILKPVALCVDEKTYTATVDHLPATFTDGSRQSGSRNGAHVEVITEEPGFHIKIRANHLHLTISIRQYEGHLAIAIKTKASLLNTGSQFSELCLTGCVPQKRIPIKAILTSDEQFLNSINDGPKMTLSKAVELCEADTSIADFYFDRCVADLLISGHLSFRMSAKYAAQDIRNMLPFYRRHFERNRTDLQLYSHWARSQRIEAKASSTRTFASKMLWAILLVLSYVMC